MPKVSKEQRDAGRGVRPGDRPVRRARRLHVNFTSFREDIDATPLLKGLPDDRCQCPHWGYVIAGRVTFRFADRRGGLRGGRRLLHAARATSRSSTSRAPRSCMFSPTEELRKTEAVMMRNMQAHAGRLIAAHAGTRAGNSSSGQQAVLHREQARGGAASRRRSWRRCARRGCRRSSARSRAAAAICLLESPRASSRRTSTSRGVSPAGPSRRRGTRWPAAPSTASTASAS